MSAQDNIEKLLRAFHVLISKSETYKKEPSKVIVDKQQALDLLTELNKQMYQMMDEYELTQRGREKAEREVRKRGDEIIMDASHKAEDIYAASVLYTSEALSRVYNIMMDTNDNIDKLYREMREKIDDQQHMVRKNQSELKSQLQDLVDTEKYLNIIKERNREIERQKNAGKEQLKEINIYADRRTEIKVNTDYLEMMGIALEEEADEESRAEEVKAIKNEESKSENEEEVKVEKLTAEQEAEIKVNLDADYFKWKEEQGEDVSEENIEDGEKDSNIESVTEGIHKMWKNLTSGKNKDSK